MGCGRFFSLGTRNESRELISHSLRTSEGLFLNDLISEEGKVDVKIRMRVRTSERFEGGIISYFGLIKSTCLVE
jgi:hypothetical protein